MRRFVRRDADARRCCGCSPSRSQHHRVRDGSKRLRCRHAGRAERHSVCTGMQQHSGLGCYDGDGARSDGDLLPRHHANGTSTPAIPSGADARCRRRRAQVPAAAAAGGPGHSRRPARTGRLADLHAGHRPRPDGVRKRRRGRSMRSPLADQRRTRAGGMPARGWARIVASVSKGLNGLQDRLDQYTAAVSSNVTQVMSGCARAAAVSPWWAHVGSSAPTAG